MSDVAPNEAVEALKELLETYSDLNPANIDEIHEEPSALEFMRQVARNRPFVVRGGCKTWTACSKWYAQYLSGVLGTSSVNVAVTPLGNADSPLSSPDHGLIFVKPHEQLEPFSAALHYIRKQSRTSPHGPIRYAQTQNDNLRDEYSAIFADVPSSIPWARIALQKEPDAINFWLGNAHSVTALHKDNYENVYAQIRGMKHFVLLPPVAAGCINEQELPAATYAWVQGGEGMADGTGADGHADRKQVLGAVLDHPPETVPYATWDPDQPEKRPTALSPFARPMRVTLDEGDLLYLPAMWYHKVSQSCGEEGFSCAVNYWYDMDFDGQSWATNNLLRRLARSAR